MALSNDLKLALDWLGLALDLLGLARIDRVLEIGELILDREVDLGMASDWHRIGTGLACIGKFRANPRQSEDNCASNQGTSLLYGMVPSLLGGRNLSHSVAIPCQLGSNLLQTVHRSQVNPAPFRCQSRVKPGSFQTQHSRSTTIFQ